MTYFYRAGGRGVAMVPSPPLGPLLVLNKSIHNRRLKLNLRIQNKSVMGVHVTGPLGALSFDVKPEIAQEKSL